MGDKALVDNKAKKESPLLDQRTDEQKENDRKSEEKIQEAKKKDPEEQASIDFRDKQQKDRDDMNAKDKGGDHINVAGKDSSDPKDNPVDYASHHEDPLAIAPEKQVDDSPELSEFVRGDVVTYTESKEEAERRHRADREKSGYRVYGSIEEENEHRESRRERRSENLDIKPKTIAGRVHSVENERLPNGQLGKPAFVHIVYVDDNMEACRVSAPVDAVKKV